MFYILYEDETDIVKVLVHYILSIYAACSVPIVDSCFIDKM